MVKKVKVLNEQGVATQFGPKSCVVVRKDRGEALTGERTGRVLSHEIGDPVEMAGGLECRRRGDRRKAIPPTPISRGAGGLRVVEDPVHVRNHYAREPGDPMIVCNEGGSKADHIGKSKDVRR